MTEQITSKTERCSFQSIFDCIASYLAGGYDQRAVFEPAPLPVEEYQHLEAIATFLDPITMAANLSGLLSALENSADGETAAEDMANALYVAGQFSELLCRAALVQSNAEYRLRLAREYELMAKPAKHKRGAPDE